MNLIAMLLVALSCAARDYAYHCHGTLADDVRVEIQGKYVLGRVSPAKSRLTLHDISNKSSSAQSILMSDTNLDVLVGNGPTNSFVLKMASPTSQERISVRYPDFEGGSPKMFYTDAGETTALTGAECEFDAVR